jgi:hypothetical protein
VLAEIRSGPTFPNHKNAVEINRLFVYEGGLIKDGKMIFWKCVGRARTPYIVEHSQSEFGIRAAG